MSHSVAAFADGAWGGVNTERNLSLVLPSSCITSAATHTVVYQCQDGLEIAGLQVCDGVSDCTHGEDESTSCKFKCAEPPCSPGCTGDKLHNDRCDTACFNSACNFDNGDCEQCRDGCFEWLRGDGICNPECAYYECGYDGLDSCKPSTDGDTSTDCLEGFTSGDEQTCTRSPSQAGPGSGWDRACTYTSAAASRDCQDADMVWAETQREAARSNMQSIQLSATLKVTAEYALALLDASSAVYIQLSVTLRKEIAATAGVREDAVVITSIVTSRRRRAHSARRLASVADITVDSEIKVDTVAEASAVSANIQADADADRGASASPLTGTIANSFVVAAARANYTVDLPTVIVRTETPRVVKLDTSSLVCAAPRKVYNGTWDACKFEHLRDGKCQCQCTQPLECDKADDLVSGDCNTTEVSHCFEQLQGPTGPDSASMCSLFGSNRAACESARKSGTQECACIFKPQRNEIFDADYQAARCDERQVTSKAVGTATCLGRQDDGSICPPFVNSDGQCPSGCTTSREVARLLRLDAHDTKCTNFTQQKWGHNIWNNDNICDEPGLCASGTDMCDCKNFTSNVCCGYIQDPGTSENRIKVPISCPQTPKYEFNLAYMMDAPACPDGCSLHGPWQPPGAAVTCDGSALAVPTPANTTYAQRDAPRGSTATR
eukprot:COSAG01_NODE_588_length_15134_cov_34.601796_14_plen_665_part_01